MGASRNRDRLYRIITDQEVAYLDRLSKINDMVENVKVKRDRREKKDAKEKEISRVSGQASSRGNSLHCCEK